MLACRLTLCSANAACSFRVINERFCRRAASLPTWIEVDCMRSAAVGNNKAVSLLIYWQDAALIPPGHSWAASGICAVILYKISPPKRQSGGRQAGLKAAIFIMFIDAFYHWFDALPSTASLYFCLAWATRPDSCNRPPATRVGVCHVYCNFKLGYTCRFIVISGTLQNGSLWTNILISNNCFSYRNIFQNDVDALSKIVEGIHHYLCPWSGFR